MLRNLKDPSWAGLVVPVYCIFFPLYVHGLVARASAGLPRVLLLLPLFSAFVCVIQPLYDLWFMVLYLFLGISFAKAVAFSINRGPLRHDMRLLKFSVVLLLPIIVNCNGKGHRKPVPVRAKPRSRTQDTWDPASATIFRAFVKSGSYVLLFGVLSIRALPLPTREALYAVGLYLAVSGLMDLCSGVAQAALGVETTPAFDRPWMSTSVREFWSRRWNIPAAQPFRWLLYEPFTQGHLVARPDSPTVPHPLSSYIRPASVVGVYAASGALHEAAHWLSTGAPTPHWRWLSFFVAQPLVAYLQDSVQDDILGSFPSHLQPWVARGITLALLGTSAHFLWFPACHASRPTCFLVPD